MPLLEVEGLVQHFPVRGGLLNRVVGRVHALNGVSFSVERGEVLGLVGESGCGKSTLAKALVRLLEPTSGRIRFDGTELTGLSHRAMLPFRRRMQIVFQDPHASLNPRLTVGAHLAEILLHHRIAPRAELGAAVERLVGRVGLRPEQTGRFPHELSGGERQRIGLARALAVSPELLVADEPLSALDVSIQAQILNLLMDLKDELGLTLLLVSHDLQVVEHVSDRILVLYQGHVVEELATADLDRARHPYTRALLAARLSHDPDERRELPLLQGEVPSPHDPPPGCPFAPRCPLVENRCHEAMPLLEPIADGPIVQRAACWALED